MTGIENTSSLWSKILLPLFIAGLMSVMYERIIDVDHEMSKIHLMEYRLEQLEKHCLKTIERE